MSDMEYEVPLAATITVPGLPETVSYSQVNNWLTCGKRYELERVVGIPQKPSVWLPGGSTFHHITEQYDRGNRTAAEVTDPDYIQQTLQHYLDNESTLPVEQWQTARASAAKQWPNGETVEWWVNALPTMVKQYVDWRVETGWAVLDLDGVPAIELEVDHYFGEYRFRAFVDRVFVTQSGVAMCVDLKTGKRHPGNDQIADYCAALEAQYGIQVEWGAYYNARGGKLWEPTRVHTTPLMLESKVGQFRRGIEAGVFIPHQSSLCKTCGVRDYCAAVGGSESSSVDSLITGKYVTLSTEER